MYISFNILILYNNNNLFKLQARSVFMQAMQRSFVLREKEARREGEEGQGGEGGRGEEKREERNCSSLFSSLISWSST